MSKIKNILAREIIDSRSTPTVEAEVYLEDGFLGRAASPSGASTGGFEAFELRDNGPAYSGQGVSRAVSQINVEIKEKLVGGNYDQESLDQTLCDLDGNDNKKRLGANATLAVSLAFARAAASESNLHLFKYLSRLLNRKPVMPDGLFNLINGGMHADNQISFQEFMIIPRLKESWKENLRCSVEIYNSLKKELTDNNYSTAVGDEGGFAPRLGGNKEALGFLMKAIEKSGYEPGRDVVLGLDVAANEIKKGDSYFVDTKEYTAPELNDYYLDLIKEFPIFSIEDPFSEDDTESFRNLTSEVGKEIKIVGDDLFVTNVSRLDVGIKEGLANAVIIKPNQIGTLSETLQTLKTAFDHDIVPIISHRSGETEDVFISHLAVGSGAPFIKSGAPARGERTAKYNELIRIEEILVQQTDQLL